ncbi:MAG: DUF4340 domain-containing protein [Candidatus Marinimicrobia bacterium]|nr:DUF4340 domain-containing protein [Candidatus Neomarinimicrobiota bacterium]
MKFKSTWLLAGILVIALLAIYLLDYKPAEEKKAEEALATRLIQFETESVENIDLISEYGEYSLSKSGDSWFIDSPVSAKADESTINSLLRAVKGAKTERRLSDEDDINLQVYGLEPPLISLKLRISDSTFIGFSLGEESPTGDYVFAYRLEDNQVFTVPKSIFAQTNKKLYDLRKKNVLEFKNKEVQRISVKTEGFSYEIGRLGSGFMMVEPVALNLQLNKVNSFLSRLSTARARKFIDHDQPGPGVTGLNDSGTHIRLVSSVPLREVSIVIGNSLREDGKPYRYVRDNSRQTLMLIDSSLAGFLEKDPFDLIVKDLLKFDKESVNAIDIKHGSEEIRLAKDDSVWSVTSPEIFTADSDKVEEMMKKYSALKASGVEEYDPKILQLYGLISPRLSIVLWQDDVEANSILVGNTVNDESYLKSGASPPIYRIKNDALEDLKVSAEYFKIEAE